MWLFRFAVACGLRFKVAALWLAERAKEPSSWASLAALLTFAGVNVDVDSCAGVTGFCLDKETWQALIGLGVSVSGFLAVIMKENQPVTSDNKSTCNLTTKSGEKVNKNE